MCSSRTGPGSRGLRSSSPAEGWRVASARATERRRRRLQPSDADRDRKAALREQALADAGVQALLEVFPAEIRDVEEIQQGPNERRATSRDKMNIHQMMKQAQQMQERMQKQMAELRIEATAGGGMVTVVVNGAKQIQSLKIDPEVVSRKTSRCCRT